MKKQECIDRLENLDMVKSTAQNYYENGRYDLAHGEYARPDYLVRKRRNQDDYYITVCHYYCAGTLGTPADDEAQAELELGEMEIDMEKFNN